jgi:hypothetical protein
MDPYKQQDTQVFLQQSFKKKGGILKYQNPAGPLQVNNVAPTYAWSSPRTTAPLVAPPSTGGYSTVNPDASITSTPLEKTNKNPLSKMGGWTSAGSTVSNIAADAIEKDQMGKKNEVFAQGAKGYLKGSATGLQIGSMFGPWGSLIGAAVGGTIGGISGHVKGTKMKNTRIKNQEQSFTKEQMDKQLMAATAIQQEDKNRGQGAFYKKGGILKYTTQAPIVLAPIQPLKTSAVQEEQILRRGGALETKKKNVIVDGPSHEEENNTGKKGDKGLPVVKNGVKVAEIESKELVVNANASAALMALYKRYKETKDESLVAEIEALMKKELIENTYDYSNLLAED